VRPSLASSLVAPLAAALALSARPGPASAADAPDPAKRTAALEAAVAAKDWARALPLAEATAEEAGQAHAEALLRVARLRALLGRADEALEALERAHAAGYLDVHALRKDEAFAALRDDARLQAATKAIWLKGYLWLLERKERDAYQKPEEVLRALALKPGERVADVGAGSGYFTLRLARAVGPAGSVLAVDANADLLEYLGGRLKEAGLANVRTLVVPKEDPKLPTGSLDTVLIVDTLHYVKDRAAWLKKVRSGLAPGGRVAVIDFVPKSEEERPWGPPPSQRMSREDVDAAMAEAGLVPKKVHGFLTEQFFVEYAAAP
jgi:ubiquinone/menaquinone biosynthesis C-methylase UbiE